MDARSLMVRMAAIGLAAMLDTGCAASMRSRLPEGERGTIRGARVTKIVARDRAWGAATSTLIRYGFTLHLSDPVGGVISTEWSRWDCISDSTKTWGAVLANTTGHCEKQASVTFSGQEATIRMSARICTQAAMMGGSFMFGNMGSPTPDCRDNDHRPYAEQLAAEQDGLARAIKAAGSSTTTTVPAQPAQDRPTAAANETQASPRQPLR